MVLFGETRLPIGQAAKEANVSPASIRRWILKGLQGVRLESYLMGGRRVTSRKALHRFFAGVTAAADRSRPAVAVASDQQARTTRADAAGRRNWNILVFRASRDRCWPRPIPH